MGNSYVISTVKKALMWSRSVREIKWSFLVPLPTSQTSIHSIQRTRKCIKTFSVKTNNCIPLYSGSCTVLSVHRYPNPNGIFSSFLSVDKREFFLCFVWCFVSKFVRRCHVKFLFLFSFSFSFSLPLR